ncbi:MAG: hypothetical protein ACI83O_000706 [Patescibacteria group bacterium]|jgi:hypothetical protein
MHQKRGQLTLFIIAGVIIVISIILFTTLGNDANATYDPQVETLKDNVLDCFTSNYERSLEYIGFQGGYYTVPEPKQVTFGFLFNSEIPYYYHEGDITYPSLSEIEEELEAYSNENHQFCLDIFLQNNSMDSLSFSTYNTQATILDNKVEFSTSIDITTEYAGKTTIVPLQQTVQSIPSDLKNMHAIATHIANYLRSNNEFTPFSDISELSLEYDLYTTVTTLENTSGIEVLIQTPRLNDGYFPTQFNTVNKYGAFDNEEIAALL